MPTIALLNTFARGRLLLCIAVGLAVLPAESSAQSPSSSTAHIVRLQPKSYAYVFHRIDHPAPLIVLLHGAGGDARSFLNEFRKDADARGLILLSIQSAGRTWGQRKPNDGEPDVANIKAAIANLRATISIDPARTTIVGFSDGASYALSIGMAYPDLFGTIVAFSPGYAFAPSDLDTEQRIFIAHSRRDPVLPAENTRRMVEELKHAGFAPEVHWFNGGHEIDPQLKKAAFDFALAP